MGLVTWDPLIRQEQVFALGGASRMAFLPLLQAEQPYFYLVCVLGFHEHRGDLQNIFTWVEWMPNKSEGT